MVLLAQEYGKAVPAHKRQVCHRDHKTKERLQYNTETEGYPESRLEGEDWIGHYELVPLED